MPRPTSVTVFGVLNIVFGVLGFFGILASAAVWLAMPELEQAQMPHLPGAYMGFTLVWGVLASVVLIASGIGLLRLRPWGRVMAVWYAIAAVAMTAVGIVVQWLYVVRPMLAQFDGEAGPETAGMVGGAIGGLFGGCIGMMYPALLWYFMTRSHVLAAFGAIPAAAELVPDSFAPATPEAPGTGDASNPYLSPRTDASPAGGESAAESIVEAFVPSKNGPALASYYLGLLSLFPCLGFPLGIVAVYYGVQGLRRVRENPEVRGGAHAWVGVICGSLFGLFNFLLLILVILAGVAAALGK